MAHNQNNDLDKLFADLKSQYQVSNSLDNSDPSKTNQIDNLLDDIKLELKANQVPIAESTNQAKFDDPKINQELDSVKEQYTKQQNQQKAQSELNIKRNKQEIIIQEQQKQLQKRQLIQQAEKWLANLDPFSDEGMWFNQLAESYPSKLEAAIDYLLSLKQSNF